MKGLILTYIIAYTATVGALRWPLYGLYVYVGFAIVRPQEIFAFAGDIRSVSLNVGIAVLVGWLFKGFGSWQFRRAKVSMSFFFAFVICLLVSALLALDTNRSYNSIFEVSKLFVPFVAGITLINDEADWRPLLWTIVLSQGY